MGKKLKTKENGLSDTTGYKGKSFFQKIIQKVLNYFQTIIILSMIASLCIDVVEGSWSKQDYDLEQARNIEVELVPHFETGLSYEDIIRDKGFRLYYDIYFINNNMNDISVSDIDYIMGNSYESVEKPSEIDSEFKEAMTLVAGSNFCVRESIWCEMPYEYLEQMIPIEKETYYVNVIDDFLKKKFTWRDNYEVIQFAEDMNQRGIAVYFTTDHDNVRHVTRFNVSYMGIDSADINKNILSVEDGFTIDKQSYVR